MPAFEESFKAAIDDGLIPGYVLLAGDKSGKFHYSDSRGSRSSVPEDRAKPLDPKTIMAIASCTKLLTAIAVLQCVERGLMDLDSDVASLLPELGKDKEIIESFDDEKGVARTRAKENPVTLRHILTHSSGSAYEVIHPLLLKYRTIQQKLPPNSGATIPERCSVPLAFEPGTSWTYGHGTDWAGLAIERATGKTLDEFMRGNLFQPLGVQEELGFRREEREKEGGEWEGRVASVSTWSKEEGGELRKGRKCVPWSSQGFTEGSRDCMGGVGVWASAEGYASVLKAVLEMDERVLKRGSWETLFEPALGGESQEAMLKLIRENEWAQEEFGCNVPVEEDAFASWSLGGFVTEKGYEGWLGKGTAMWFGFSNCFWFVDRETGLYGMVGLQLVVQPSTFPKELIREFHHGIYDLYVESKGTK